MRATVFLTWCGTTKRTMLETWGWDYGQIERAKTGQGKKEVLSTQDVS